MRQHVLTVRKVQQTELNKKNLTTRMWADAQRDGRPAKCMWRPLLNAVDQIVKIMKQRRKTH